MSNHNLCFEQKYEKYQSFFICKFSVFGAEIFYVFEYACFCNEEEEQTNHCRQYKSHRPKKSTATSSLFHKKVIARLDRIG